MSGLLIIGEWTRAEMHPAVETAATLATDLRIERCRQIDEALRIVTEEAWYPDVVLVCQSWPDEFAVMQIHELIGQLPLARWICCFGAWCESDGRNRNFWPIGSRVPARSAISRIRAEFVAARGELPPLPMTASRDECFLFDYGRAHHWTGELAGLRVALTSPDREYRNWLGDVARHTGAAVVPVEGSPDLVLWDVDPWNAGSAAKLQAVSKRLPNTAIVAMAGFAHSEDVMAIELSGAAAVVSKLSPFEELLNVLQAVARRKAG